MLMHAACTVKHFIYTVLNRKMYWSDWQAPAKIEVANMDGTGRQILVQGGGLTWPNGLSVDYTSGKLYWADARSDTIECVDLDGSNRKVVLQNMTHPFGLDVYNGFIYWTDWTSKDIRRAKINDPSSVVVLRTGLEGLMEIRVYDLAKQTGGSHRLFLVNDLSETGDNFRRGNIFVKTALIFDSTLT